MNDATVRLATSSETRAIGRLIAESFSALPVSTWLAADPAERRDAMSGQFAMIVDHAIRYGTVHTVGEVDDQIAAAIWFPHTKIPEIPGYGDRLAVACGRHLARFVELDDLMDQAHPESPPHAYLALMAVLESERDRGIGAMLLDEHHRRLDADGIPAYLEASGEPARRLYLRHGYVDAGEPYGPDGIREFRPMWRAPR